MVLFRRKSFDLDVQLVFRKIKGVENFQHENSKILYVDGALALGQVLENPPNLRLLKKLLLNRYWQPK